MNSGSDNTTLREPQRDWLRSRSWRAARLGYLVALCGCASLGVDGGLEPAQIRFVEVSPGAPPMDFYLNGAGAAYGVGYESFTSYLPVGAGPVSLGVNRAGTGQNLFAAGAAVSGGHQYTAMVSHGLGGLQERLFEDQGAPAPAGQMALRVLNAVGAAAAITIYVTPNGNSTAPPQSVLTVAEGTATPYANHVAGVSYTVTATVSDGSSLGIPVADVNVTAGSRAVRTVVFGGTARTVGGRASVVGFVLPDADAP